MKILLLLFVFMLPAHAAQHTEAEQGTTTIADFASQVNQKAQLPMTAGHVTWLMLSHTDDTLVYTYLIAVSRTDIDIPTFLKAAKSDKLQHVCPLLKAQVVQGLRFMEFVYYDNLGRDLSTMTLSLRDCK